MAKGGSRVLEAGREVGRRRGSDSERKVVKGRGKAFDIRG